jgi:hypothetical protein
MIITEVTEVKRNNCAMHSNLSRLGGRRWSLEMTPELVFCMLIKACSHLEPSEYLMFAEFPVLSYLPKVKARPCFLNLLVVRARDRS